MLTEEQVNAKMNEIISLGQDILKAQARRNELCEQVQKHNKEKVEAKYPDIKSGDKVKVVSEYWNGTEETLIGYFGGAVMTSWDRYSTDINDIKIRIYKPKKDGSPSLRYADFYQVGIVSIEKVI